MAEPTVHGTFDEVIQRFDPALRAIAHAVRLAIKALHAQVSEVAWPRQQIASYGVGPKEMSEHYAYIAPGGTARAAERGKIVATVSVSVSELAPAATTARAAERGKIVATAGSVERTGNF